MSSKINHELPGLCTLQITADSRVCLRQPEGANCAWHTHKFSICCKALLTPTHLTNPIATYLPSIVLRPAIWQLHLAMLSMRYLSRFPADHSRALIWRPFARVECG